jgi:rSAM-partnered protein
VTGPNETSTDQPRSEGTSEWEMFLRDEASEPPRHVGSVSAPTEAVADERASSVFGGDTHAVWLCPAASVARFTDRDLGAGDADVATSGGKPS